MKILEKILGVLIILALIMKFSLIMGGSIVLVLSLLVISIIYYPLGFAFFNQIELKGIFKKVSYKGISALRIIGAICVGVSLATVCEGILFRLQRYPGGNIILMGGLICTLLVGVIALIRYLMKRSKFYIRIFIRIAIIAGFGLLLAFTSDFAIAKVQFRNHPDYLNALEKAVADPKNEELWQKVDLEHERIFLPKEDFERYEKQMEAEKEKQKK